MAEFIAVDFAQLGADLRAARRSSGRRTNPAPASVKAIYDEIGRKGTDRILLSVNPKVVKGMASKYATAILHFASSNTARKAVQLDPKRWGLTQAQAKQVKNVCPQASKGCIATCLVGSGHGGMGTNIEQFKLNKVTQARIRRQLLMDTNAEGFFTVLILEIAKGAKKWRKKGYQYVVRLNGTSDIDWENIPVDVSKDLAAYVAKQYGIPIRAGKHASIMSVFPKIRFYDYTKVTKRYAGWAEGRLPKNYYLTFSLSEQPLNRRISLEVLKNKVGNVAVPFDTPPTRRGKEHPLPKTLTIDGHTFKVYDADKDDLRFLDTRRHGKGMIAGLRFKLPTDPSRRAKIDASDFRIKAWPDPHPAISTSGGNVSPFQRNPRRHNPGDQEPMLEYGYPVKTIRRWDRAQDIVTIPDGRTYKVFVTAYGQKGRRDSKGPRYVAHGSDGLNTPQQLTGAQLVYWIREQAGDAPTSKKRNPASAEQKAYDAAERRWKQSPTNLNEIRLNAAWKKLQKLRNPKYVPGFPGSAFMSPEEGRASESRRQARQSEDIIAGRYRAPSAKAKRTPRDYGRP